MLHFPPFLCTGKCVRVYSDFDLCLAKVCSAEGDIDKEITEAAAKKEAELTQTKDPRRRAHIEKRYKKHIQELQLHQALLNVSIAHYKSAAANDPQALADSLNAAIVKHLGIFEAVKRNLWFTAR